MMWLRQLFRRFQPKRFKPIILKADPELEDVRLKALAASHGGTIRSAQRDGVEVDRRLLEALDAIETRGEAAVIGGVEPNAEPSEAPIDPREVPTFAAETEAFKPGVSSLNTDTTVTDSVFRGSTMNWATRIGMDVSHGIGEGGVGIFAEPVATRRANPPIHVS